MHPIAAVKHIGHDLHEGMQFIRHHVDRHLLSRRFWIGFGAALLAMGMLGLLLLLAARAPLESIEGYPVGFPFAPYIR